MLLADAEKLTLDLMRQFKLIDDSMYHYDADWTNWRFEFDDAKRRFGCCHMTRRLITLSRVLVSLNDREQVEDTIRHEIAHALCPSKTGHGPAWTAMCKRVGANPERCYDSEDVEGVEGDWQATCGACGHVYHKFRKPKRELWCSAKECKSKLLPYVAGMGHLHPMRKLAFRHRNAIVASAPPRSAIEAMKARLRVAEQEPGIGNIGDMLQCVRCDSKSIGSKVCPGCGGELKSENVLRAEKEELKRKIAKLQGGK